MSDDLNKDKDSSFGTPPGYFGSSAQSLLNRLQWIDEHRLFPHLADLKNKDVFAVPDGYFSLATGPLELLNYPSLNGLSKVNPFTVPEDYFETNALNLQLNAGAGIVSLNKNADLFRLPEGYFENSASSIAQELSHKKRGGRIISLRRGMKFSMAALLLIVFGIWIYNLFFAKSLTEDCGTLACVDREEVVASKNIESLENEDLYELVNTAKLKENLEKEERVSPSPEKDSSDSELLDEVYDDI